MTEIRTLGEKPGKIRVIRQGITHQNSRYSLHSPLPVQAKNEYSLNEFGSLMGIHESVSWNSQSDVIDVRLLSLNSGHYNSAEI